MTVTDDDYITRSFGSLSSYDRAEEVLFALYLDGDIVAGWTGLRARSFRQQENIR